MKTAYSILATAIVLAGLLFFFPNQNQGVNAILGDISFYKMGGTDIEHASENDRIRMHLEYVESMLRARDVSHLSPELQQNRNQLLDLLNDYWNHGIFPTNTAYQDQRRPCFIDERGHICAVGYLVEMTAGREAAEVINNLYQYDYIGDMDLPLLSEWVQNSGLTVEECAMIQPQYGSNVIHPVNSGSPNFQGMFNYQWSMFNPAFSGLVEKTYIFLTFAQNDINQSDIDDWILKGGHDWRSEKLHSGMGYNFSIGANNYSWQSRVNTFNVNYNYQFKMGDQRIISVGVTPGYMEIEHNPDLGYAMNEDGTPLGLVRFLTIGSGVAYTDGRLAAGISATNINEPSYRTLEAGWITAETYEYHFHSTYSLQVLYTFFKDRKFDLIPAAVFSQTNNIHLGAFNITCHAFNKKMWGGVTSTANLGGGRTLSYSGLLGVTFKKKLNFGGSFDIYNTFVSGGYKFGGVQVVASYSVL